jgi:hypothetical protein
LRPRLLLVPEFTELEWVIRPKLAEWAEVATYDPPGVGGEPIPAEALEAVRSGARAHVVRLSTAPASSPEFVRALREFCTAVEAGA